MANQKRYASVGMILLFFIMSSSFAFPETADVSGFVADIGMEKEQAEESLEVSTDERTEESGAVLAGGPSVHQEVDIVDDNDILEGYEDAELHGMEETDQYTIDDIIDDITQDDSVYQNGESAEKTTVADRISFDAQDWRYVLINKQHPIPEDYSFDLVTIKGNMQCDSRIREDLLKMLQAAKQDGINLVIRSPYRDMSRQEYLFSKKISIYMRNGMTYMDAYKTASQAVTVPGASEHQIGLAIDITSDGYAALNEGFGDTQAGEWLAQHSCEYGFILRYPKGKEYITSIEYEPWHFRYVGKEAATTITEKEITLEEFVEIYL